jgi:lipopolysaccharide export system protein LptA
LVSAALLSASACAQGLAAKADKEVPLTFDAGQMRIDGKRKVRVLSGGVELTRGGFVLKASEVEVRDAGNGQVAVALSSAGQLATFRQKREGLDESVEGQADRIEYETTTGLVRMTGKAWLRRLRGSTVSEEVSGQSIVYDQERETFEVQGGAAGVGSGANTGRIKGVVTPRPGSGDSR